jgi:hypothetical protein
MFSSNLRPWTVNQAKTELENGAPWASNWSSYPKLKIFQSIACQMLQRNKKTYNAQVAHDM